jgi:hypothetical protein
MLLDWCAVETRRIVISCSLLNKILYNKDLYKDIAFIIRVFYSVVLTFTEVYKHAQGET